MGFPRTGKNIKDYSPVSLGYGSSGRDNLGVLGHGDGMTRRILGLVVTLALALLVMPLAAEAAPDRCRR